MIDGAGQIRLTGFWSATAVALTLGLFGILLVLSLVGLQTISWSFVVVMLMGVAFVALQASLYSLTEGPVRIYALLGLVFAVMFATFISIAYYLQLAVVRHNTLGLTPDTVKLIAYAPGSAAFALDMLGFGFLCLSLLALVPLFGSAGDQWLRTFLIVNGALALPTFLFPTLRLPAGQGPSDQMGSVILIIWCAIFLPVPVLLARRLRG